MADISLPPEQVIQGRLFDVQGRPAQGVVVSVSRIHRELVRDPGRPFDGSRRPDGPMFGWARVNDLPAWPKPATTDSAGLFTIHGVGRGLRARTDVIDPRFASQMIDVETDDAPAAQLLKTAPTSEDLQRPRHIRRHRRTGSACPVASHGQPLSGQLEQEYRPYRIPDRGRRAISCEPLAGRSIHHQSHAAGRGKTYHRSS